MAIRPDDIKRIRRRAGLTQEQLAQRLAVTRDTVASWEIGRSHPRGPAEILIRQIEAQMDAAQAST